MEPSPPIQPFDLHRMFIGDENPYFMLEIIARTTILFLFALLMVRLLGKRGMKQLTPFEYIIVILLGSAAGDPMFYPDVPLLHGMTVITTVVLLQRLITKATQRNAKLEKVLESEPMLLIEKGYIKKDQIKKDSISEDEMKMQLRMLGISDIGEV